MTTLTKPPHVPRASLLATRVTALFIAALAAAFTEPVAAATPATVIRDVTVIAGDGSRPVADRSLVIRDGRIEQLGTTRTVTVPEHAEVIDGRGRYLVPGFVDTHAHLTLGPVRMDMDGAGGPALAMNPSSDVAAATGRALLAHGITLARDPGGHTPLAVATRDAIDAGTLPGPRLQVAGEVIDTSRFEGLVSTVAGAADVRGEVARQHEAGVDWIKLYIGLEPELVDVAIDAAHRRGLRVTGHLQATTWTRAADLGIDSLVHASPGAAELLPEGSRARYAQCLNSTLHMLRWFDLVDVEAPQIQAMVEALRQHRVPVDPTLVVYHSMAHADRPEYRDNPALASVPEALRENWRSFFNFNLGWTAADYQEARALYPAAADFVRFLHDSGVTLTVGTDANNPWVVPGDSYHRELELLVDAGIPPLDVLTMATANGAALLGESAARGTIEVGKAADMVLLDGNPADDIRATRDIVWVMQNGVRLGPDSAGAQ